MEKVKPVKERTTSNLIELSHQLHARTLAHPGSKELHDASVEARKELDERLEDLEEFVADVVTHKQEPYSTRIALKAISIAVRLNLKNET